MKGQRLFVRPSGSEDTPRLVEFYRREGVDCDVASTSDGLVGFLVGDMAAHLLFEARADEVEIRHIWVAKALRRKRVGRVLIAELGSIAKKLGAGRLVVRKSVFEQAFLRLGFEDGGEDRLIRLVE